MQQATGELGEREQAVATRAGELDARVAELEAKAAALAKAEEAHTQQSRSLEQRAAQVAERERELDERGKAVAARELLVRRATPLRSVPSEPARGLQIDRLERLVAARRDEFPDRAAECDAYLFELRGRAGADGTLPHELSGLVEDVFAPLL